MNTNSDELERICTNCNHSFPSEPFTSDFAICLNDPDYEPYLDDILENQDFSCCQKLIKKKRFSWEQEACPDFDPVELPEEEIPLSPELRNVIGQLAKDGNSTSETTQQAIFEDMVDRIDWASMPVDEHVERLNNAKTPKESEEAVQSLGGLISLKNKAAFHALCAYLKVLPPPTIVEQTHFRIEILRQLKHIHSLEKKLARLLVKDLFRTPSNNTTRGWYTAVFKFFENSSVEIAEKELTTMLYSPQFSHRIKRRVKTILDQLNWRSQRYL